MSTLTNKRIKDTYDGLLKTEDSTQGLPATGQVLIEDGVGNDSALQLGKANNGATITGQLDVTGDVVADLTGDVTGNLTGDVTGNVTGDLTGDVTGDVTGDLTGNVTGGTVNAEQVIIEGDNPPLIIKKNVDSKSHIQLEGTDGNAYVVSRNSHISIGGQNGYSASNVNIKKSNGYLGLKQREPLAPLHVKRNGEAIRLEGSGDNITSIDFRQGTNKRGHIEFDNSNDTLEIKTTNPTGATSKIKFSTASGLGQEGTEVMRIQKNQVVIGNPVSAPNGRELYIQGGMYATENCYYNRDISVDGRVDADSYKLKGLNTAPTSSTDNGVNGEIKFTADYIYVCVQNNVWKRVALQSF